MRDGSSICSGDRQNVGLVCIDSRPWRPPIPASSGLCASIPAGKLLAIEDPERKIRLILFIGLAPFFLDRYNTKFRKQVQGISDRALKALSAYHWPGNIRELENLIERLVAVTDKEWITDEDLPFEFHVVELDRAKSDTSLLDRALGTFERNFLVRALERNAWNVTQTARYLGVPLSTLKFKIERLDIRELARKIKK